MTRITDQNVNFYSEINKSKWSSLSGYQLPCGRNGRLFDDFNYTAEKPVPWIPDRNRQNNLSKDAYLFQYGVRRKLFEANMARKKYTMLDVLEDWAKIQPNEKCLLQDDKIITYQERF